MGVLKGASSKKNIKIDAFQESSFLMPLWGLNLSKINRKDNRVCKLEVVKLLGYVVYFIIKNY